MSDTYAKVKSLVDKMDETDVANFLYNLSDRWKEEKEYEDFEDYVTLIKKRLHYIDITKVTKRPFGFHTNVDGVKVQIYVRKTKTYHSLVAKLPRT